jgi:hypothetical protein
MALAALLLITGLGMSDLTASSVVDHTDQTVNRALKGDRLPLVPAIHRFVRNQPLEFDAPPIDGSGFQIAGWLRRCSEFYRKF